MSKKHKNGEGVDALGNKTKRFLFTNSFHKTKIAIRAVVQNTGKYTVSASQFKTVERALCGSPECACGVFRDSEYRIDPWYDYVGRLIGGEVVQA